MRWAVISLILAFTALIWAPMAIADGDPASDVLVSFAYFDPVDLALPPATSAELTTVLTDASRAGFPIRVALIAGQNDLGTVTSLWRQPVTYAAYLQDELQNLYGGQVLVVMPDGFGLRGPRTGPHSVSSAELAVKAVAPGPGVQLASAALSAVPRLAAADGHPIPAGELSAALHASAPASPATASGGPSIQEWLALLLGLLLIAAAWTASLRARPLARARGWQA